VVGWDHGLGVRDHLTHETFGGIAHLGHRNADFASGRLDWFRPRPIARVGGRRRALVVSTAQECSNFLVHRSLQDQPRTQPTQFGQSLAIVRQTLGQELGDLCL